MQERIELHSEYIKHSQRTLNARFRHILRNDEGTERPHRSAFITLEKHITEFLRGKTAVRWIIMPGLRGTGKTTLFAQIASNLTKNGIPASRILYVSLDEVVNNLGSNLNEIIAGYERILGRKIEEIPASDRHFLIVDEAHYDPNWGVTLKTVYDRTDRIFILVTGSSSISLMTNADTVRRARFEKLYPLSFVEYHLLKDAAYPVKNLSETLRSSLYSSSDCVAAFKLVKRAAADSLEYMTKLPSYSVEEYLRVGTLPASIQYSDENVFFEMVSNTLDKVISNDIALMAKFSSETQKKILRLVSVLALSERTNIDSLCGDIGISKPTMIEAIDLLEKSELIYPVRPIASAKAKILKSPKYRFLAASIRASLLSRIGVDISDPKWYGVLLEDAAAMYLYKSRELRLIRDFNFDPIEGGADFIVARNDGSRIVIEVGFGRKDTGMRQISVTRERAKPKYSILISDKGPDLNKDESIIFIPKELFLLS